MTAGIRVEMPKPERPGQSYSMDFVSDQLSSGRRLKILTIVDDHSRESPALEVDFAMGGERVCRVLDRIFEEKGYPRVIRSDNGPEFAGKALDEWAYRHGVLLDFIDPGKPVQNAYVESFNGKFRDECLNEHWFMTLEEAREEIELWRQDYNEFRPHSSLENLTPKEFAAKSEALLASQKQSSFYSGMVQ